MFSSVALLYRLPLSSSPFPHCLKFPQLRPPIITYHNSLCSAHNTWISQLSEQITNTIEEGPIELPSSSPTSIFATTDDPTPLQITTSVLLTGAITVFLFRSLRRRVKRAKELKFRSSGAKKSLKEEAVESLKTVSLSPVNAKSPPSPVQAFLGALTAGVIALILYKFTTTIEASLNRQSIPDGYSARQITVTIRTIINGLCYLATSIFGINSFGLFLYSGQLALNSFAADSSSESNTSSSSNSNTGDVVDGSKISNDNTEEQSSDDITQ